jgi:DNA repair protein RadA/Sms
MGIYEMHGAGLREVSNPSEILISQRDENLSGIAISATIEGLRPLLIETQALVSTAAYGTPQRNSNGYDAKRLNMLLAILEKKCGLRMGMQDVFINITGRKALRWIPSGQRSRESFWRNTGRISVILHKAWMPSGNGMCS